MSEAGENYSPEQIDTSSKKIEPIKFTRRVFGAGVVLSAGLLGRLSERLNTTTSSENHEPLTPPQNVTEVQQFNPGAYVESPLWNDHQQHLDKLLAINLGENNENDPDRKRRLEAEGVYFGDLEKLIASNELSGQEKLEHLYQKGFLGIQVDKDLRAKLGVYCLRIENEEIERTYTPEQKKVLQELYLYVDKKGYSRLDILLAVRSFKRMIPVMKEAQDLFPRNYVHEVNDGTGTIVQLKPEDLIMRPGFFGMLRKRETGGAMKNIGDQPAFKMFHEKDERTNLEIFCQGMSAKIGQNIQYETLIGDPLYGAVFDQFQAAQVKNAFETLKDIYEKTEGITGIDPRLNFGDPRYGLDAIIIYLSQTSPSNKHYGYNTTPLGRQNGCGSWNPGSKTETDELLDADRDFTQAFPDNRFMILT